MKAPIKKTNLLLLFSELLFPFTSLLNFFEQRNKLFFSLPLFLFSIHALTQTPDVHYVTGSSQKIQQLIGDWEFQLKTPTSTLTNTRYNLKSTDLGVPFRHNGITYILFGDTQGGHTGDLDCIGYTTDMDPDDGISLDFLTDIDGTWLPITIPTVDMAGFNVPTGGVGCNGNIY